MEPVDSSALVATGDENDLLSVRYVRLSDCLPWDRNPKLHDIRKLVASIIQHGFKDPPKFEPELNGGAGGTAEGNGRLEALQLMFQTEPDKPPRGIALVVEEDGSVVDWAVPFLFGVDAPTEKAAQAYAIDHNNLTLRGADFSPADLERIYEVAEYHDLLVDITSGDDAVLIASLSADELAFYTEGVEVPWLQQSGEGGAGDTGERDFVPVTVNCYNWDAYDDMLKAIRQLLVDNPGWRARIV